MEVAMKLKGFVVIVTLFALHTTAFSADVFSGTWKTIIEKSQFSPGPILKPSGPNFTRIESVRNGLKFAPLGFRIGPGLNCDFSIIVFHVPENTSALNAVV